MLADEYPELGILSPAAFGGTGLTLHLHVDDADALAARALRAGATMVREPADYDHGERQCRVRDPFGHEWLLGHEIGKAAVDDAPVRPPKAGAAQHLPRSPVSGRARGDGLAGRARSASSGTRSSPTTTATWCTPR